MVYKIHCILPRQRSVYLKGFELIPADGENIRTDPATDNNNGSDALVHGISLYSGPRRGERDEEFTNGVTNTQWSSRTLLSLQELGERFGFEYSARLQFLHESELRTLAYWGVDQVEDVEWTALPFLVNVENVRAFLDAGRLHEHVVSVREIGVVGGIDLGFGLFAEEPVPAHFLIGEYVGVVSSTGSPTPYSLNYPSGSGGHEINASDVGNIIRFVNHSATPNAIFRSVLLDGLAHVLCVRINRYHNSHSSVNKYLFTIYRYMLYIIYIYRLRLGLLRPESRSQSTTGPRTGRNTARTSQRYHKYSYIYKDYILFAMMPN